MTQYLWQWQYCHRYKDNDLFHTDRLLRISLQVIKLFFSLMLRLLSGLLLFLHQLSFPESSEMLVRPAGYLLNGLKVQTLKDKVDRMTRLLIECKSTTCAHMPVFFCCFFWGGCQSLTSDVCQSLTLMLNKMPLSAQT